MLQVRAKSLNEVGFIFGSMDSFLDLFFSLNNSYVDLREKAQRMRPPTPAFPQTSNGIKSEKENEELSNIRISNN